ncbi:DUF397 domain-containing protein [Streptomyces sp. NPDC046924]|uniref:DUF397 domain-containing protein n=1 Tax=Streptomyces sp. NPDC046924 TaxID=3155136 RepID=UPI0033DDE4C4
MSRTLDLTAVAWRKSSYSEGGDGNCVEVADGLPVVVPVRDSKTPHGPVLRFPATAWTAFLSTLKGPGSPTA